MNTIFKREFRYYVFKVKDVEKYCNSYSISSLREIGAIIDVGRAHDNKAPFACVVVENDWPMYESTWNEIEKYHADKVFEEELLKLDVDRLRNRIRNQRVTIQLLQKEIEQTKDNNISTGDE